MMKNGHGDVTALVSDGAVTKAYDYDAYGVEKNPDPNDTNPFRYCAEYFDQETQNIYLRNRYYNSSNGRFLTEDPAQDGLNWYVYCGNNPVMRIDPSGLYDRWVAVQFALENAYNLNVGGYHFDYDCTDFISKCLEAGGLQQSDWWWMDTGSLIKDWNGKVYSGKYNPTWSVAKEQFMWIGAWYNNVGLDTPLCLNTDQWIAAAIEEYNIRPGDLLYWDFEGDGEVSHASMIVSVDNGTIIYAQHTDEKDDGNLNRYLAENKETYVYVVRVRDDA